MDYCIEAFHQETWQVYILELITNTDLILRLDMKHYQYQFIRLYTGNSVSSFAFSSGTLLLLYCVSTQRYTKGLESWALGLKAQTLL